MKLTNRTISRLWNALHDLDGEKKSDGSTDARFVFKGTVLYAFARNINHLRAHQVAIEKTTEAIVRQHAGGKPTLASDAPAFLACNAEIEQVLDAEVEVDPHRIKIADLDLDKNHLRPVTVAGLEPIIDG